MISLDLFGDPVAKMRAGRKGRFTYDPQQKLKEGYKWQVRSQYREDPLTQPVIVDAIFMMPIPKSTSKVKQRAMLNGTYHHIVKPDVVNILKFYLDVLNNLVLKDDNQVVEVHARKIYSSRPGVHLRILPVENLAIQKADHAHDQRNSR